MLKKLKQALEDVEDIKDIQENLKAIQDGKEILIPEEVTVAILDGVNPVRAVLAKEPEDGAGEVSEHI